MASRHARITEEQFQRRVVDTAHLYGWRVVHYRAALSRSGRYRTPLQGDQGAPDLLLAKQGRVLLVELKSDTGRLGPGQAEWATAIGPDLYRLWRPRDWDQVQAELARPMRDAHHHG